MFHPTDKEILKRFKNSLTSEEEGKYIYSLFADNEYNDQFREYVYQEFISKKTRKSTQLLEGYIIGIR